MDEELRIHEKGIGNDCRAGCPTRCRPRVPDGQKNNPGNEQLPGSPFPTRESHGRKTAKRIHGWLGSMFIGYSAAGYFHTCEIKIKSWTKQAKKMRGSMSPKFEVRDVLRTLEEAGLENKLPIYDDGRMIVEKGHMALEEDMKFATRKY